MNRKQDENLQNSTDSRRCPVRKLSAWNDLGQTPGFTCREFCNFECGFQKVFKIKTSKTLD